MDNLYLWLSIAVMALVTAALRFLPFVVWNGKRGIPAKIVRFGKVLPYAIMGMLVIYCLKGISFAEPAGFLPELIAGAVVVLLHVWKRNTLLSIICGTVFYMLLVQVVFK